MPPNSSRMNTERKAQCGHPARAAEAEQDHDVTNGLFSKALGSGRAEWARSWEVMMVYVAAYGRYMQPTHAKSLRSPPS